jgi:L-ascorbate metabolism protein UlaG (beta-lactamase superfamily)
VLIELAGVRVLTDPLLRSRVAHLRRQVPPVPNRLFADVDIVLISHLHHDHLDLPSLRLLGLDSALVVPLGAGSWLRRRGFSKVTELSVGEVVNVAGAQIVAVPAHHARGRLGGPSAEPLGYLVGDRRVVYFAGDTERFASMAKLAPNLDVALLPVAGWGPTLGPGHMGPLDAARALAAMQPRIGIPVHWGSLLPNGLAARHRLRLGDPPRRFAEHAARLAPAVDVRILAPGEATAL